MLGGFAPKLEPAVLDMRFVPVAVVLAKLPSSRKSGPVGAVFPARIVFVNIRLATPASTERLKKPPPEAEAELPENVHEVRLRVALPSSKPKL